MQARLLLMAQCLRVSPEVVPLSSFPRLPVLFGVFGGRNVEDFLEGLAEVLRIFNAHLKSHFRHAQLGMRQ